MRGILIGLLHLVVGVGATFGWMTYADEAGLATRPFDTFIHTLWPMGVFVMTGAFHAYCSGLRQGAKRVPA